MKQYKVNVNGNWYEVAIELVNENDIKTAPAAPVAVQAPAAPAAGAEAILAPMPGSILDVKVAAGTSVKKGDLLLILEAMKMENEILASRDGVVASVNATKGSSVQSGDVLLTLN